MLRRHRRGVVVLLGGMVALTLVIVLGLNPRGGHRVAPIPAKRPTGAGAGALTGWLPLGEPGVGGRITSLAINPEDDRDILVGGDILGVGLSQNGGRTWQATAGFASWEINAFTWDQASPRDVWVGTLSGPYESMDGGHTWYPRRDGMPTGDYPYSAPIQKILVDADNPMHLLAFGGNQRELAAPVTGALHYGLVYSSADGGVRWARIANVGTNWNITDAVGSRDLKTLYASVVGHGIYKSTDAGHAWTAVNMGLPNTQVMALVAEPNNPQTVWAALAHAPELSNGFYAAGGIYKTTDGGGTWVSANSGIPRRQSKEPTYSSGMDSLLLAGDGTLYTADQAYGDQNRYSSNDGGADWKEAGAGVTKAYPAGAAPYAWASSADGGFIIGGTSDSLIASTDGGTSWYDTGSTRRLGGWHGNGFSGLVGTRIAFSSARPRDLFLTAFDAGNLLRTTNGGASWTRPLAPWDNYNGGYDVSVGGEQGGIVYAVLGQAGVFNGVGVSRNAGRSWSVHVGGTLPARYDDGDGQGSVAVASRDGATAYAVLPDEQLYRTSDTGATWSEVPLSSPAYAVAASRDFSSVYVATGAGVMAFGRRMSPVLTRRSPGGLRRLVVGGDGAVYGVGTSASPTTAGLWSDGRGSWHRIADDPWAHDVAIDPDNRRRIVYVTNDDSYQTTSDATGVWISCNGGQSFAQYNRGLPMLRVLSVAFDPSLPGRLIVGTNGRGFWQARLRPCAGGVQPGPVAQADESSKTHDSLERQLRAVRGCLSGCPGRLRGASPLSATSGALSRRE